MNTIADTIAPFRAADLAAGVGALQLPSVSTVLKRHFVRTG
jgi:hypothetical protein